MEKLQSIKTNQAHLCAYVDAGMTLFPCRGYSKIPARAGFLELPFDPEFIPQDHNYGVLLKQRYLVIDCDPRAYTPGDKPLSRLFRECGQDPELYKSTFTIRTPRSGFHVYFTKPEGVELALKHKDYPGLEFKTKFIMACGSFIDKTEKGEEINKGYVPVFGKPSSIIPAPQVLLARLLKPKAIPVALDNPVSQDNEADIQRFVSHCLRVEPAIENDGGDLRTYQVACEGRELGLSQEKTASIMLEHFNSRCEPPWDEAALRLKVQNAYIYATRSPAGVKSVQNSFPDDITRVTTENIRYHRDKNGEIKKSLFNLKQFFEYPSFDLDANKKVVEKNVPPIGKYLKFDQFSHRILWAKPAPWFKTSDEWQDQDAMEFRQIISREMRMEFNTEDIHQTAKICANRRAFHPVRDYLESCKWDGKPRLDNWLVRYCGARDNAYIRFVGRTTLIAAVARVFRPGCKFDHVLVMEGMQGLGKSFLWETLTSPWFTDAPLNIQDKSAVEVMHGKWVVELAEMDALSKYENQTIKGFLTRTEDRCRMAYARNAENFPRQNIFVGSLNPEVSGWLKDRTGNRRYWPVAITHVDLAEVKKVRHELWAEALLAFERGEKIYVEDGQMQKIMAEEVSSRMQEDPWFGMVEEYLHEHIKEYVSGGKALVSLSEMYVRGVGGAPASFKFPEANRIASILKILGFEKTRLEDRIGYVYVKEYVEEIS